MLDTVYYSDTAIHVNTSDSSYNIDMNTILIKISYMCPLFCVVNPPPTCDPKRCKWKETADDVPFYSLIPGL